jgi:indolepyruvate ferredoxin oxidoreductase alpha subunit
MGIYYTLSQLKNLTISGDIGCYTLGAGHPVERARHLHLHGRLDGRGARHGQGPRRGRQEQADLAVIGDSTFMHMGMQGLLDITYNRGNVTVLLLDNHAPA